MKASASHDKRRYAGAVVRFLVHRGAPSSTHILSPSATVVAVIPARYQSSRLPGKPLADIGGRPMVEHVYRRAAAATAVGRVLVATDDARIHAAVTAFGGEAWMTSAAHQTGTDRLAEVVRDVACEFVVNLQGDEPLIDPSLIDDTLEVLAGDPTCSISTVRCPISGPAELADPSVVKVVVNHNGDALYFSRSAIPYHRAPSGDESGATLGYKHVGLYAYRRECLLHLASLQPTPLERMERLEQLRALESGHRIHTVKTTQNPIGVDTPDDLEHVRRLVSTGTNP